jgi:hypothetical protein
MAEHDEPETKSIYRVYWQPVTPGQSRPAGPWLPTSYVFDDRAIAEASAERFCRNHNREWSDRRNYAVVQVKSRPIRLYLAPMGAG